MTIRWARTAALALFSALFWTGAAAADVERETRTSAGDHYEFKDDLLHTLPHGALGTEIVIPKKPYRVYLLRPLAHFVPEMLKSVERI